jgi:uncharacterized membrane protein
MAELDDYLDALRRELPLPQPQRDEAVEEIAAHVADSTADLVARGVAPLDAERRVLARFGPPDRLADALAAARRGRWQLVTAAGVAMRVTIGTGLWALIVGAAVLVVAVIAGSLLAQLGVQLIGWTASELVLGSGWNVVMGGLVAALAAYAVGRALPPAVALAARRRVAVVRPWILGLGCAVSAWIGIFLIEAEYEPISLALTALLPVWFALGVLRPRLLPSWLPGNAKAIGLVLVLVATLVILPLGLLATSRGSTMSPPRTADSLPPTPSFERIAPMFSPDDALFATTSSSWAGTVHTYSWELADASALQRWSDVHVEVWAAIGPADVSGFSTLDPAVSRPLSGAVVDRSEPGLLTAELELPRIPGRDHYLVALVGTHPDGARRLLTPPEDELSRWAGSVWEYLTAERRW